MTNSPLADADSTASTASDGRPEFLVRLGLLLPCSADDVEAAYRNRAKVAHPDAGGSTSEFTQLQADYEAALEFARFHASRRGWLAANVERYLAQQQAIAQIERLGGTVETQRPEWIAREIGEDFAHLLDTVVAVRLTGSAVGPQQVQYLADQRETLANLHRLDLSDSRIDHRAVKRLAVFTTLHELDLSGTYVGNRAALMLAKLPALRRVNLSDTFASWLARLELRRRRRGLQIVTRRDRAAHASTTKRVYRWLSRALFAYILAMIYATHTPETPEFVEEIGFAAMDKLIHVGMYTGLSCLLALVLWLRSAGARSGAGLSAAGYVAVALLVSTYATLDELTQPWTGRERDFMDWLADLLGMAVGLLLFTVVQRYLQKQRALLLQITH
jgi:VanZ family protein